MEKQSLHEKYIKELDLTAEEESGEVVQGHALCLMLDLSPVTAAQLLGQSGAV